MTTAVSLILVFCSAIMVRTSAVTSGMESSAVLMERIPEASIFMDQRRIERSLTPPTMSQLRKSFTSDSVPESGTLVIPDTMSQILSLLISKSPPHQLYLLYDSNYRGLDDVLEFYSNSWMECTVIEYTPDLEYFVDVISTPLISTNTGRRHIVVICSRENVMEVFKTVSSKSLESVWNWWIIFVMEEETANLLRNIIREGSIVLLVVINPGENTFKLFSSHIEQNGDIRYKVMKPADGKWGGPLPDGTITGMIGEVARRNAHIAICEITVTGVREGVIDFTMPYYLEALTIISSTPAEKNRAFAVFSPFGYKVWICIALSTLIIGPLLTLESFIMKKYLNRNDVDTNLENFSFNMFRSLVVQTNRVQARYWPHRFTFVFWYLFCLNILVIYSGTLTAVLVTPAFEKPIDDLTDLPQAIGNGFTLGIVGETSFEYLFKEAKQGIYKETWNLFNHKDRSKSFFSGPDEPFDKILPDKLIFINAQLNSRIRATTRGLANFHFAKQLFYPQGYGIVCFSGAPFRSKFDQILSYMTEGGLISKWADEEVMKVAGKSSADETKRGHTAITVKHLQAAFFVLLFGFLIAAVTLVIELTASKF